MIGPLGLSFQERLINVIILEKMHCVDHPLRYETERMGATEKMKQM